jgi:rhamnulose-1-phosphate aldolase/alcohol dehydrogenase
VDHTHPDAIIALACAARGEAAAREVFGENMAWVNYIRPGFDLSKQIGLAIRDNPNASCVIMGKHGLVTWGPDGETSYANAIAAIQKAEDALEASQKRVFTGVDVAPKPDEQRKEIVAQVLPLLRGLVGNKRKQVVLFDDGPSVLKFVGTAAAKEWSQIGAACPDHLVHTKRLPLWVDWDGEDIEKLKGGLREGLSRYQSNYVEYFKTFSKDANVAMFDPSPRVILVPGLGMFNVGRDATAADVSRQLYARAIAVMELTSRVDSDASGISFVSLSAEESFNIEYWPLELYKLSLRPAERELAGRVALVTGGASGIGKAIAQKLAKEGAHVVIADIALDGAQAVADEICQSNGFKRAVAVKCNVTREDEVVRAFKVAAAAFGGVDIVVNNAGIATSNPIEDTTLEEWQRNMDILATGYFLIAREAFKQMKQQARGGSIIFIGSKNSVYAGKNASAYSAAKAAELHLARCLAEEGGASGIRVNTVLPDAVLQGSNIWNSAWKEARAKNYGIKAEELDEYYRSRTTLKVNIFPEDIAEAVFFFASDRALKTTGAMMTVDGGVPAAYGR